MVKMNDCVVPGVRICAGGLGTRLGVDVASDECDLIFIAGI
jgi:hypothetical protein